MTRPRTPTEVFLELVHGVAAGRGADLAELYAENTNVIHPMEPMRSPAIRTRADLQQHFGGDQPIGAAVPTFQPVDIVVHLTSDPEVIIAEFAYRVTRPAVTLAR